MGMAHVQRQAQSGHVVGIAPQYGLRQGQEFFFLELGMRQVLRYQALDLVRMHLVKTPLGDFLQARLNALPQRFKKASCPWRFP